MFPKIKRLQQPPSGCAIACVAMVAGVSYDEAFLAVHDSWNAHPEASYKDIIAGLRKLGFSSRLATDFRRQSKRPAILVFEWRGLSRGVYHSVVWDHHSKRFVDPGYKRPLGEKFYMDHWRKSERVAVMLTGKARTNGRSYTSS